MLNLFNFVSLLKNIFVLDFFKESFLRVLSRHLKIISKNDGYLPWKIPEFLNFASFSVRPLTSILFVARNCYTLTIFSTTI